MNGRIILRDLDPGLWEPGHSEDRTVVLVAASPGDIRSGGLGFSVEWGFADSPFGLCSVGWIARGVCHMAFHDGAQGIPSRLLRDWPEADFSRNDGLAARAVEGIFHKKSDLPVFVRGTAFQLRVWRALLQIPEGTLMSYSRIASSIGSPRAIRAVGTACGANPVAYLIPCHRVVHKNGSLQGYRWGTERKKAMIARESPDAECRQAPAPTKYVPNVRAR